MIASDLHFFELLEAYLSSCLLFLFLGQAEIQGPGFQGLWHGSKMPGRGGEVGSRGWEATDSAAPCKLSYMCLRVTSAFGRLVVWFLMRAVCVCPKADGMLTSSRPP